MDSSTIFSNNEVVKILGTNIINNSIDEIELITKSVDKLEKTVDEIAEENKKLVVAAIKGQGGRIDD